MAVNKNAFIRYQVLDKCFRNPGRMYFWKDLQDACNAALLELDHLSTGIQRRQLFDDIKFMESEQGWNISLIRHKYGRKVFYRYEDSHFSINSQPLNDAESNQLKSAIAILSRFSGTPQFEWINKMLPSLQEKLGMEQVTDEVISYEANIDLKGIGFLATFFNAINNKRVLKVRYKDFHSEEIMTFEYHPYYLKQYNNRWFVFGLNNFNNKPTWNLPLDRIESIEEVDKAYIPSTIDWYDHFYDIIGVTRLEGEPETVELLFTKEQAPYISTKPLHPSQKEAIQEDGSLLIKLEVILNFELEMQLLAFGEKVVVLKPEALKKKMIRRLKAAFENY